MPVLDWPKACKTAIQPARTDDGQLLIKRNLALQHHLARSQGGKGCFRLLQRRDQALPFTALSQRSRLQNRRPPNGRHGILYLSSGFCRGVCRNRKSTIEQER